MQQLQVVFNSLNGLLSSYSTELLQPRISTRALTSMNQLLWNNPTFSLESKGDRAFAVAVPNLWNNLLFYIKVAQSFSHFKRLLKTPSFSHLLSVLVQQHGLAFVMQTV